MIPNKCIVSAFYRIPSKRPFEDYLPWLVNWFRAVKSAPAIFFTTPDVIEILSRITPVDHVHIVYLPFEELIAFKQWGRGFWDRQYARDAYKPHSADLGAVWYEKKEFVLRATELFKADVYIWCDAGCIRGEKEFAAAQEFGSRNAAVADGRLHMQQLRPAVKYEFYEHTEMTGKEFIAGAIMAGTATAWRAFKEAYDTVLRDYDKAGYAGIMDQFIMASVADRYPDRICCWMDPVRIDPWFKFLEIL
jgi:hypothetical protein